MMNNYILTDKDTDFDSVNLVGGKASNLFHLSKIGVTVPPWFVVTTEMFKEATKSLSMDGDIQEKIKNLKLSESLKKTISDFYKQLSNVKVAVRSSATAEDSADTSFAGLHDSFLYINSEEGLIEAIKNVWASAFNDRAIEYRKQKNLPLDDINIAVIVQEMVDADVSGVMFTVDPVTQDVNKVLVNSVYGLGEGLVSGGLDADQYRIDKLDLSIDRELVEKNECFVHDKKAGAGVKKEKVSKEKSEKDSLSDEQIKEIFGVGQKLENYYKDAQDVEFSFSSGKLYLLQTRPITNFPYDGPAAGNKIIWDNSNIIESYSGVTSPMTFSFIKHAYSIVYHCFSKVMGIPEKVVRAHDDTFNNMLGLIRGQVYYNIMNWYEVVKLFPGYEFNKEFMENMMGVKEKLNKEENAKANSWFHRYFVALPSLLKLVFRMSGKFFRIRRITGRFQNRFNRYYNKWDDIAFDSLSLVELKNLYHEMESKMLWHWQAPIINDFFVMIFYGVLQKLCPKWCEDESGSLQNDLISGEGDIESTMPTKHLLRMAKIIYEDEALRKECNKLDADKLLDKINNDHAWESIKVLLVEFLKQYGFRCPSELKLEEPSFKERPELVVQIIKNYVSCNKPEMFDLEAARARELEIRSKAEEKAYGHLSGIKKWVFSKVLNNARLGVKNRENMRFARTKIYGLVREILLCVGDKLAEKNIIGERDDIFYLTVDEVWDYISGTAVTVDLNGLVGVRKKEFGEYREDPDIDERITTYGLPYFRSCYVAPKPVIVPENENQLVGIACCPGVIKDKVKVLLSPEQGAALSGEILVASRTDPGWVTFYPSVSGLLIERGSILSHSAIVAREMGIPTIVGLTNITKRLKDGDVVEMDGATGLVTLTTIK